jgi:hypothetical protein
VPATATSRFAAGPSGPGALPPLHILNTKRFPLQYRVTQVGPSGLGKVELWMTRDDGRTWEKYGEDRQLTPPMQVELREEGVYGFRLVLQSRAGLGKKPPASGDLPEIRVEVDTTPPTAQLFAPEVEPRTKNTLLLTWSASDRNLAANPITLQYSAELRDEAWQTIATDLPNTGRYTWELPANIPARVYLKLIVRDLAGNVAVAATSKPELIDLTEPEGQILGIDGAREKP